jgi:hypothetical protein
VVGGWWLVVGGWWLMVGGNPLLHAPTGFPWRSQTETPGQFVFDKKPIRVRG